MEAKTAVAEDIQVKALFQQRFDHGVDTHHGIECIQPPVLREPVAHLLQFVRFQTAAAAGKVIRLGHRTAVDDLAPLRMQKHRPAQCSGLFLITGGNAQAGQHGLPVEQHHAHVEYTIADHMYLLSGSSGRT